MAEFRREIRYIVVKRKHITAEQEIQLLKLIESFNVPTIEAVVVESDWNCYEPTWKLVEQEINERNANESS